MNLKRASKTLVTRKAKTPSILDIEDKVKSKMLEERFRDIELKRKVKKDAVRAWHVEFDRLCGLVKDSAKWTENESRDFKKKLADHMKKKPKPKPEVQCCD
jgi:hypothetical protein